MCYYFVLISLKFIYSVLKLTQMRLVNAVCLILAELLSLRKEGLYPNQINKLLHKKETLFNPEILSLSKFKSVR